MVVHINYGTKDNREFHRISQLTELEGVYNNKGDWEGSGTLADIIWQYGHKKAPVLMNFQAVEFIEVSSSDNSITVKAIQDGCAVYEKTYVVGQDFDIKDGKIIIFREFSPMGKDVFIGPIYMEAALGLDIGKDGKFRSTNQGAGLALFIPYSMFESRDVRFNRVSDKPQGYPICHNILKGSKAIETNNFHEADPSIELFDSHKSELEELGGGDCSEGAPKVSAEVYLLRGKALVALNEYKAAIVCLMRSQEEEKNTQVYRDSCTQIALMYELGWGVEKNIETSKVWH